MSHSLRSVLWLSFFGIILWAWWVLYTTATGMGLTIWGTSSSAISDIGMSDMGGDMVGDMAGMTGFWPLFLMWAIMMAAMMLPTMVPTLSNYDMLIRSANGTRGGWIGVLAGFFTTWVGFAALIALVQVLLFRSGVLDMMGQAVSLWFSVVLLLIVGIYQFTPLKDTCHGVCHSPMQYFLGNWRTGTLGGYRMGLGLGAFCVGCCWGFMAIGFVGGVMNLLWMGLATLVMVIEKLPQVGHYVTRPLGVGIIGFAGILAAYASGLV